MTEQLRNRLNAGLQNIINKAGTPIRVITFTSTIGSVWDDDVTLSEDTITWTSGIELPVSTQRNSDDSFLLEQGKIREGDIKLFMHGSLLLTGSEDMVRIGIGSPPSDEYSIIDPGFQIARVDNQNIYKKVYLRRLAGTGSILGE